jgi:hypothetical protein
MGMSHGVCVHGGEPLRAASGHPNLIGSWEVLDKGASPWFLRCILFVIHWCLHKVLHLVAFKDVLSSLCCLPPGL